MEDIRVRGQYLLESSQWSDCKFLVGELPSAEIIQAHKLYLASSSPIFETMFYGSMPEGTEPIEVPEVQVKTFKMLLKYIYTNRLALNNFEEARDLHYCAKKYMMPALAANCINYMKSILSYDRVCKIYEIAELNGEAEVSEQCLNLMRNQTKKILTHSSWKDAATATVSALFEQDSLGIDSEMDLYHALVAWSKAECARKSLATDQESLRSVSGNLVTKIRFLTLSPEQFTSGPGKAEILDKNEAFAIIMNILSCSSDMPRGFTVETKHRHEINGDKASRLPPVRAKGEIYCCRPHVASTMVHQFTTGSEYRFGFTVDRKVKIHGVILPSKSFHWRAGVVPEPKSYPENLYVSLSPLHGPVLTSKTFATETRCGSDIEIKFDFPFVVEKDEVYRINVVFKGAGNYFVARNFPETAVCEGVNFSFPPLWRIRRSLIRGILFSA